MAYELRHWLVALAVPLLACGPSIVGVTSDEGTTSSTPETSAGPGPATSATTEPVPDPSPESTAGPGGITTSDDGLDDESESTDSTFITRSDIGGVLPSCDSFAQDCPPGEKCTFYSPSGFQGWDWVGCVPIADDPVGPGETCTVEDSPWSGLDDCELGSMCWDVDPATDTGTCVSICTGSEEAPTCEPGFYCAIAGGPLALCLASCNPLTQDCGEGEGCFPASDQWLCAPEGKAGVGEPCAAVNACASGLICESSLGLPGCEATACCTDLCDLGNPECAAADLGAICQPWYVEAPPGYEDVGVCLVP